MEKINKNKFPIDMVYLWCNGQDPDFIKRKNEYRLCTDELNNVLSTGDIRFFDNDELKYSLRSLEKNAPWINHIFIVTDRQIPEWLNINNERITIVDHSELLPLSLIPCFNSSVIERYIGFIPNLQEHFLYGNDDTFFGEPVSPEFFFTDGIPIVRLMHFRKDCQALDSKILHRMKEQVSFYENSVINSWELLFSEYKLSKSEIYVTHHNIDAFTKSDYRECFYQFQKDLNMNLNRFRSKNDIQRILFSMNPIFQKKAIPRILHKYSKIRKYLFWIKPLNLESYCIEDKFKSLFALKFIHPKLFCINNSDKINLKNKKYEKIFLEHRFPHKSSFEL